MSLADIRVALRTYLIADAAIAAVIDSGATAPVRYRAFSIKLPQGENRTSIVFTRVSGLSGVTSSGREGLTRPRIQIDCWAPTADAACSLADLVKERIDGFRGAVQWDDNSPGNAITVQGVFMDMEREDYDDAAKLYRMSRDYLIWFEE